MIFLLFCASILISISSESHEVSNFLVLYDEDIFRESEISNLQRTINQINNNSVVEFMKVANDGNLNEITRQATVGKVDNNTTGSVVFIFANNFQLLSESLRTKDTITDVVNFGTSFQHMHSIVKNSDEESCLHYDALMVKSLVLLVYSFNLKSVAIITDETDCNIEFCKTFEHALRRSEQNQLIHLTLDHVIYDFHGNEHRHHMPFYRLKSIDISLIVLLVPHHHVNELLNAANQFSLLSNSHIWLIPNYEDGLINKETEPAHYVTLDYSVRSTKTSGFEFLQDSLPRLVADFNKSKANCTSSRSHSPELCLKTRLYSMVVEEEYEKFKDDFFVHVRSLNNDDAVKRWEYLKAEVKGENFYVLASNITMLLDVQDRSSFQKIRATFVNEEPYIYQEDLRYEKITRSCNAGMLCWKPDERTGEETPTCCVGFLVDLLQLILQDVDIDIDLHFVGDGQYGGRNNNTWNGVIGEIVNSVADIGIGPFAITNLRLEDVDFTRPWLHTKLGFVTKPELSAISFLNFEFVAPVGRILMVTFFMTILAMSVVTYILDNTKAVHHLLKWRDVRKEERSKDIFIRQYYSLVESLTYITGVALQRDVGGENPRQKGSRVSSITFAFGMCIIVSTYTALLVEQGVNRYEKEPFQGSKDTRFLNPTPSFTFGTLRSSNYESFFQNSKVKVYKRISNFMTDKMVDTVPEGIEAVKNRKMNSYMDELLHLSWFVSNQNPCSLEVIEDNIMRFSLAFPVRKNFPWLSVFNEAILQYRESDELQKLYAKWFHAGACPITGPGSFTVRLGISNFGGLIFITGVTIAVCFILLLPEHFYWRYMREKIHHRLSEFVFPNENGNGNSNDEQVLQTIQRYDKDGSRSSVVVKNDKVIENML